MSEQENPNEKGRYWAGLIYPGDSCPEDWQEQMRQSGLEILVSPQHDQDIADASTGQLKKVHRHVIAMWPNTTTRRNAQKFFAKFNGPKTILRLENPRGMARYLIHMDDPEKAQYSPEDVLQFNGADWQAIAIPEDEGSMYLDVKHMIEDHNVRGYFDLLDLREEKPALFRFVAQRTNYCREAIWSYWKRMGEQDG